ncbi:hypothetical protein [Microcoleus sp. CAWBG58]|jgi:hypothetical protein|uniref:hypothetical protein n=1 Tax=Microcoleus sp. CAWBG58 TaxID=2841651 RepID=UPI0025D0EA58|nr:hypothetical protein [Microcoleus sp. CAWBG58]
MNQVQIYMPPPLNWQDFETLIEEIAKTKYSPDSVQSYGGQGQAQHGIDVYAVDHYGKHIGIQCKQTKQKEKITEGIITTEAKKANSFLPALSLLIIATTQNTDAKLQNVINIINQNNTYNFKIQIWFWDDINRDINRSFSVMYSCYKEFQNQFGISETKNHLNILRLAFDRPAFKDDFLHERNYDDFEQALASTKQMLKTGFLFDRWSKSMIANCVPIEMIGDPEYKEVIDKIEKKVEKIYQMYLRDKRKFIQEPQLREDCAGKYNIQRRELIKILNKMFESKGLNPIVISY